MMEENEKVVDTEIDLRVLLGILRKNLVIIIIVSLLFAGASYAYTRFFVPKQYEANATLIVNNKSKQNETINTTELTAAQNLAEVYSIIIKSDTVLQPVINDLGLKMSYEQLSKRINVSSVNSTQVINVSLRDVNAQHAKQIIEKIVEIAPDVIKNTVEAGSVKVISDAKVSNNGRPVGPNSTRNGIIGGVIGLVLIVAVVFIKELMTNTFKTEEDVLNTLGIPLLGVIPLVDTKEFNKNV